ncbi:MAG: ABC transporter ATP-binding protein [Ketobacter sp.]|nr:ABC transporter ATP-binding protein [Ketobacter sp.]
MISLDQVCVSRGGRRILDSVSIQLTPGKITAIVGPNGSGKSSLLKVMVGAIAPTEGTACVDRRPLADWKRKELARVLAYLPQSSERPNGMTVEEVVACGRFAHLPPWANLNAEDRAVVAQALQQTEMLSQAEVVVDNLSGGEMQRVWLATVLAQGADLLLLDEPNSFLDLSHQLELMELIQRLNQDLNKTIALVIHDLNQAIQWCDEVVVMKAGQVQAAGAINLLQDPLLLKEVFNLSCQFVRVPGNHKPVLQASLYRMENGAA